MRGASSGRHAYALDVQVQTLWLEGYLFELPFDSGVPDNYVIHSKDDASAPIEEGWEGFDLSAFLQLHPPIPTPNMCSTTLAFRRALVPQMMSFDAVESAFPEVIRMSQLGHPLWRRMLLRSPLHRIRLRLMRRPCAPRTVVHAIRIALPPEHRTEEARWRDDQITTALRCLNDYLEALAGGRTNLAVGSVRVPDLSPLLFGYRLILPEALSDPERRSEHFAMVMHEYVPWSEPLTRDQAEAAWQWSLARGQPLWMAMRWLRDAERSWIRESLEHAVIEAGTAIELAVADTIRSCGLRAGYSSDKITNVLAGDFAGRVRDHFAALLSFEPDPKSAQDTLGSWWREGYELRNRVVHEGHQPTRLESGRAVGAANALLDDIIDRILTDVRYEGILLSTRRPPVG